MSERVKRRLAAKTEKHRAAQQAIKDARCQRVGATWEQIVAAADDCGCCFTGLPEGASESLAFYVYWDYRDRE